MIQLKKTTIAVVCAAGSLFASVAIAGMYAPPAPVTPQETFTPSHGLYVGIGAGFLSLDNEASSTGGFNTTGVPRDINSPTTDLGNTGFNSYLLGGYSWTFPNRVFLAGEIFGNLTNTGTNIYLTDNRPNGYLNNNASMTLQSVYGVRALPGYQVTDSTVLYGIVGYAHANASSSDSMNFTSTTSGVNSGSISGNNSLDFNGYQLGLGSMVHITEHLAIRGDLIYSGYGDQTVSSTSTAANGDVAQTSQTANPSTWEGDVGLVYTFNS